MSARPSWRSPRLLDGLAAVCVLLSAVVLFLPASTTTTPADVRVPSMRSDAAGAGAGPHTAFALAALDSARRTILQTNAFSASRREPIARFVAPGMEPEPPMPLVFGMSSAEPRATPAGPRLFGIVSVSGTPRALLQVGSANDPPRLLSVGEAYAGVRVVRIDDDRVVISSSSGMRTLRLSRVVPDSSEKVP